MLLSSGERTPLGFVDFDANWFVETPKPLRLDMGGRKNASAAMRANPRTKRKAGNNDLIFPSFPSQDLLCFLRREELVVSMMVVSAFPCQNLSLVFGSLCLANAINIFALTAIDSTFSTKLLRCWLELSNTCGSGRLLSMALSQRRVIDHIQ